MDTERLLLGVTASNTIYHEAKTYGLDTTVVGCGSGEDMNASRTAFLPFCQYPTELWSGGLTP